MRTALLLALRPLLVLALGLSVGHRARLPRHGPAIIAANHNSHVDILALLAALPASALRAARPVAAADYFLASAALRFVALRLLRIVSLDRGARRGNPLREAEAALAEGAVLIVFPEGTRGAPETMGAVKNGLSRLAGASGAPVVPVYIQGAGRILPKGTRVPVPFTCTVLVGERLEAAADRAALMGALTDAWARLKREAPPLHWH